MNFYIIPMIAFTTDYQNIVSVLINKKVVVENRFYSSKSSRPKQPNKSNAPFFILFNFFF